MLRQVSSDPLHDSKCFHIIEECVFGFIKVDAAVTVSVHKRSAAAGRRLAQLSYVNFCVLCKFA